MTESRQTSAAADEVVRGRAEELRQVLADLAVLVLHPQRPWPIVEAAALNADELLRHINTEIAEHEKQADRSE